MMVDSRAVLWVVWWADWTGASWAENWVGQTVAC